MMWIVYVLQFDMLYSQRRINQVKQGMHYNYVFHLTHVKWLIDKKKPWLEEGLHFVNTKVLNKHNYKNWIIII